MNIWDSSLDVSAGEPLDEWASQARLRVLETLFRYESGLTLEQVTRHLAGVNPLDALQQLQSLDVNDVKKLALGHMRCQSGGMRW